jgi:DTW domain-containing protein YfiP
MHLSEIFIIMTAFSVCLHQTVHSFSICLLTHKKELYRKTNTGHLVESLLKIDGKCRVIQWGGRNDNEAVEASLRSLAIEKCLIPTLLWTDRYCIPTVNLMNHNCPSNFLYVVIDATWQEVSFKCPYCTSLTSQCQPI